MFSAQTIRLRRVRNVFVGAAMVLASVVGVAPGNAVTVNALQPNAEPFVDVSAGSVDRARAQTGAATASGPDTSRGLSFNRAAMRSVLADAPDNSRGARSLTIDLPAPDGSMMSFNVWESAVMAPELAAAFPEITTYSGQAIDDPAATIVFDVTPHGFHAQVLSPSGAWYIDPAAMGDAVVHESFFRSDRGSPEQPFIEGNFEELEELDEREPLSAEARAAARSGTQLRTLRTVVSATSAYTALNGGTRALAQSSIVTAVNRVSGIYVTEIATRLQLVAGNENLVYVSGNGANCPSVPVPPTSAKDCDPFANSGLGSDLLDRNQVVVDSFIKDANYDIGHVFTENSGLASAGVGVTGEKAKGTTGNPSSNDGFWVDFVAHEMGHQLAASHTFNGVNGNCEGNAEDDMTARVEPGSGSTIQGYAGICGLDDLQQANEGASGDRTNASDPYFNSRSFDQIMDHYATVSVGMAPTGNSVPTANAGLDVTVPAQTPFFLTAAGSDADGDTLTYNFEQRDGGTASALTDPQISAGPLFRSFQPTTSRTSFFPRLSEVAVGNTNQNGSCAAPDGRQSKALCWSQFLVPTGTSRAINFRATVRDNSAAGGGVNTDDTVVNVAGAAGPFRLTAPNGGQTLSGSTTVTWNVGGTGGAPVSAATVSVRMSTDGGLTFPTELLANTPNDGSAEVSLSKSSSRARLMVHSGDFKNGAGFFDISDANFTASGDGTTPPTTPSSGFTSVNPARLLETRKGPDLKTADGQFEGVGRGGDGDTIEFQVTGRGGIPDGAEAASLNVVAISADGPGYLTVYPCDQDRPIPAASVNYDGGDVRPNAVLTKLSATGTVCIYTLRATDLVVDVNGAFAAGAGFESVNPARLLETRKGPDLTTADGQFEGVGRGEDDDTIEFQVTGRGGIPDGAEAASLNVVAIFADGPGYLTVYPCDQDRPDPAASVNYDGGDVRPNAVLTKLSETGTVCIYTLRSTDLVVDVNGAFSAGSGLEAVNFGSINPARLLETRTGPGLETIDGQQIGAGRGSDDAILTLQVTGRAGIPEGATAASLNVVAIYADGPGYLTVYPCDQDRPDPAASVNYNGGDVRPNAVLTKLSATGTVCIYTLRATDVVVDVNGAFT
jgi:hypothetical protein